MSYNILLVDDDHEFREEFKDAFYEYQVVEASNGEDALTLLKKPNEIDLVVLDVMMPGSRGTDILKQIKDISPGLGIIILTGHSSKDVAVEALKGRADDYIEKPIVIDKMKSSIDNLLEAKGKKGPIEATDMTGKIAKVKNFAERNWDKKVSLKDAAQAVYLSPKYLSRLFKESTGIEFSEYKLGIKIKRAKELLLSTGYNIDQIADKVGYQNIESFIRIFKKLTGSTPSAYRKKNNNPKKPKRLSKKKRFSRKTLKKTPKRKKSRS